MVERRKEPGPGQEVFGYVRSSAERARTNLKPIMNRVVFQLLPPPETTVSGKLYLPEISQDKYSAPVAVVVACGPDCKHVTKPGQVIVLAPCRYGMFVYDKHELCEVVEADVLAVVEDE